MFKTTLTFCVILLCITCAKAQYADLGTGGQKDKIWWFDWAGFTMMENATRNFVTTDGLNVSITFTNVSSERLYPSIMNTWRGAVFYNLYNFSNTAIRPALYGIENSNTVAFKMQVRVTRNGTAVPFTLVTADAEASAPSEITNFTTDGSNWGVIDFYRNTSFSTNPITGCGTNTVTMTNTYGGSIGLGQIPLLATAATSGTLNLNIALNKSGLPGAMGLTFGIFSPVDRGDLPAAYGYAQHRLSYDQLNSCNYTAPMPTLQQNSNLYLGRVVGDADGLQTTNDNTVGGDEEAISSFPVYDRSGSYSITVPVHNTTGAAACLMGWFDSNNDQVFSGINESVTVSVPVNATSVTLTWTGLPAAFTAGVNYAFRLRLSSDKTAVASSTGFAPDGEVEDYVTTLTNGLAASAAFSAPDTVCVNTPVAVTNMSQNATSYYWNFNSANLDTQPATVNLGNIGGVLDMPVYSDIAEENGNYYVFVLDHWVGKMIRLDFGNSLLNTPTARDLGTLNGVLKQQLEGIQVVKNEGKWYAIIVGGHPTSVGSYIIKVEFGAAITNNTPVATNWGNIGNLNYPIDLHLFKEGNDWYGLSLNQINNTLTRFDFTSSFDNTPTGTNLGGFGGVFNNPAGICCVKFNGEWYAFMTNDAASNGLVRLYFGSSLLNTPSATVLVDQPSLNHLRDIYVMPYCDGLYGFAVNGTTNELLQLNFGNDITNNTPALINYGNVGNFSFPHSISKMFRVGGDLYSFIPNVNNNTISRVRYSSSVVVNGAISTVANPAPVTYTTPGNYNINLVVDEGLGTQVTYCKTVTVVDVPAKVPIADSMFCADSIVLKSRFTNSNIWSDGSSLDTLVIKSNGTYWVETSRYGCVVRDTFVLKLDTLLGVFIGNDTTFCRGGVRSYQLTYPGAVYQWQDGSSANAYTAANSGTYHVRVTNTQGCTGRDTAMVSVIEYPLVTLMKDTAICENDLLRLGTDVLQYTDSIRWSPGTGMSDTKVANPSVQPTATITYTLTAYNAFCASSDYIVVQVNARPQLTITGDEIICRGDALGVQASGAASYSWLPNTAISNATVSNPVVTPIVTTRYVVTGAAANGCTQTASVLITVNEPAVFGLSPEQATICEGDTVTLVASGGDAYQWLFAGTTSGNNNSVARFVPVIPGSYRVIAFDNICNKADTLTALVTIHPLPQLTVAKSNDIDCVKGEARLTASGASYYQWYPAGTLTGANTYNPLARNDTATVYHVRASSIQGCVKEDSITVLVLKNNFNAYPIASAFTPNGDGLNDCFGINKWGMIKQMELAVFNRWGERVFVTNNPNDCWDGKYKGQFQPPGTFVFTVKAETLCGTVIRNGSLVLIR
ncbi:gliding motility-associated C-terminal domain-containing protein [Filimonas lacunae]|uniref:Gliding motility-associated C-terminal domain-containing protein n=1 Tax=Filimonas lacunae TaxID=477680 RepID=A0A173MHX4_9BACT|nr:CshA/CshB family fibrillar adhesin-related protein [Filimonas lacunae]BAV07195.1 PKD domain containing protein [Filimonas lacunae]SIS93444.1 gliding motility-associated C-terminal domain-containing protein [Filimonas lacunae]